MKLNKCQCGGTNIVIEYCTYEEKFYAYCVRCGKSSPYRASKQSAADAWNGVRRVRVKVNVVNIGTDDEPWAVIKFPEKCHSKTVIVEWTEKKGTK